MKVRQVAEIIRSRNLLWNLTLRELRAKYRRSVLGWAWSMLNPLSQMLIYTVVFGAIFGIQARPAIRRASTSTASIC